MEVIRATHLAKEVEALVADSETSYVPSIVLAEISARLARGEWGAESIRPVLLELVEVADVVEIDPALAVEAGVALAELRTRAVKQKLERPGLADAVILATARKTGSMILSGDPHFAGLPECHRIGTSG